MHYFLIFLLSSFTDMCLLSVNNNNNNNIDTGVSGQRPRLTLTFFCTLLRYLSVVSTVNAV